MDVPYLHYCLTYNVREFGKKVAQCKQGFKYLMVIKHGVIEESGPGSVCR